MKKILFILFQLILLPSLSLAATTYYAQSAAGNGSGDSCANAKAIASITHNAGDISHLCGIITTPIVIGANNEQIIFETDAKFSAVTWTTDTAAITCSGKSGLVVNGGTNGIIEATDNGTGLGSTNNLYGIMATTCDNIEVKNLTIQNVYNRTADSSDSNSYGTSVYVANSDSANINNNTIVQGKYGIFVIADNHDTISPTIYSNNISRVSWGIAVAIATQCNFTGTTEIYGNTVADQYYWDGTWSGGASWHHSDGVHIYNDSGDATHSIETVKIYNNLFGGDFGEHTTAMIFIESWSSKNQYIYNNVLFTTAEAPSDGLLVLSTKHTDTNTYIFNNTIIGQGTTNVGGNCIQLAGSGNHIANIKNNICQNAYVGIYDSTNDTTFSTDYNDFYNTGNVAVTASWYSTLSSWRTALGGCPNDDNECSSITTDPLLAADYKIPSNSPAKWTGTATGQLSSTDKSGFSWHIPPSIGAFEYDAIPTITSFTVDPSGAFVTIHGSENLAVTTGAGYTLSSDGDAVTLTHSSISGTDIIQATSRTILSTETLTYSYTGTDTKDLSGNELAAITNEAVTNSSTQTETPPPGGQGTVFSGGGSTVFSGAGSTIYQ